MGGRGASSGKKGISKNKAGNVIADKGGGNKGQRVAISLDPNIIQSKMRQNTDKEAERVFSQLHSNSKIEYHMTYKDGKVLAYNKGIKGSVAHNPLKSGEKGMHNHPKQIGDFTGGQYSAGDFRNWAYGNGKGTSVTTQYGNKKIKYTLEKTSRFSSSKFLNSARSSNALIETTSNIRVASANIGNFLKQNQKQLGYKYKVRIVD